MKKIAILLLTAMALSLVVMGAAGDDLALESAGTKIIDVCGGTELNPAVSALRPSPAGDAANGNKWCCVPDRAGWTTHPQPVTADYPHFIVLDLGAEKSFDKYNIDHGQFAEGANFNAQEWYMEVSNDNKTWVKVDEVKGNTEASYAKTFTAAIKARYVKITIPVAEQGSPGNGVGTIRIYHINIYESAAAGTFPGSGGATPTNPPPVATNPGASGGDKSPATGDIAIVLMFVALIGSGLVVYRLRKA